MAGTLDDIGNGGVLGMQPELPKLVALKDIIICYGCNFQEQSVSVTLVSLFNYSSPDTYLYGSSSLFKA